MWELAGWGQSTLMLLKGPFLQLTLVSIFLKCLAVSNPPSFHWLSTVLTYTHSSLTLLWDILALPWRKSKAQATPLHPITSPSTLIPSRTRITGMTGSVTIINWSDDFCVPRNLTMLGCRSNLKCWNIIKKKFTQGYISTWPIGILQTISTS